MRNFTFVLLMFISTFLFSQEIPNLTFSQQFDYPENDPQDGSSGSVLSPENWTEYNGYKNISYVAVTSYNEIPVASTEAVIFRIYLPPYVEKVSIGINGPDGLATEFMRVATILEDVDSTPFPVTYNAGDLQDNDWRWLGSMGSYIYTRDIQYKESGSAMFFVIYNGANVDDNYDGVPEGDYPNTLTIGSFTMSWQIPLADTTNYIDWANGTTEIKDFNSFNSVEIFPNPAKDFIYVKSPVLNKKIDIFDVSGRKIISKQNVNSKINISEFNKGIYIIKSGSETVRFVKE